MLICPRCGNDSHVRFTRYNGEYTCEGCKSFFSASESIFFQREEERKSLYGDTRSNLSFSFEVVEEPVLSE